LFAIFYCYRRRRAQKLKKLLEMEKAHSARPTITQQQQQQQQQQPPPPYYAGLENKGRDQSLMNTSHGSMLDDAASKNALYATQNGYGYAVASAQNNGGGHANGGGDWVNMAYTEHSYSNSNNGGSVNSQDSLWQLKLASQNGGVNGGGADHQLGNVPDSRSYHYDPMTHGGYGGFEDYSHYPPSNGDDYLQRNNYGVVAGGNGDPYAAVHKNGKRMEHLGMFSTLIYLNCTWKLAFGRA
jgi:echinoid protein